MNTVFEPGRQIPIAWEGDLCVLGGSGVLAYIIAAIVIPCRPED